MGLLSCAVNPEVVWLEGEVAHSEVRSIHVLGQELDRAWDRRDAQAFASQFIEQGSFQFPNGRRLEGKAQIQSHYAEVAFPSFERDLVHQTTPMRIQLVNPTTAIGDGIVHFVHSEAVQAEDRLHLTLRVTSVVVKRHSEWKIAAVRLMAWEPD